MPRICVVKEQMPPRTFQGSEGLVTVVELLLSDGLNTFIATASEKDSSALISNPLAPGTYISVMLQFTALKGDKGYFQKCRLIKWGLYAF